MPTNASNSVTSPMNDDGVDDDDDDLKKQIESMKEFIDMYGNEMIAEGKKGQTVLQMKLTNVVK